MSYPFIILLIIICGAFKGFRDSLTDSPYSNQWAIWFPHWAGPHSWRNKHRFKGVFGWLMRGPLVAFTDARHFFELVHLTCWQTLIALYVGPVFTGTWIDFLILLVLQKILLGIAFEAGYLTRNTKNIMYKFTSFLKSYGHRAQQILLVLAFVVIVSIAVINDGISTWLPILLVLSAWAAGYAIARYARGLKFHYEVKWHRHGSPNDIATSYVVATSAKEAAEGVKQTMKMQGVLDSILIDRVTQKQIAKTPNS